MIDKKVQELELKQNEKQKLKAQKKSLPFSEIKRDPKRYKQKNNEKKYKLFATIIILCFSGVCYFVVANFLLFSNYDFIRVYTDVNEVEAQGIAVDNSNNIYALGIKDSNYYVNKYDPMGTRLANATVAFQGTMSDLVVNSKGELLIVGSSYINVGGSSIPRISVNKYRFDDSNRLITASDPETNDIHLPCSSANTFNYFTFKAPANNSAHALSCSYEFIFNWQFEKLVDVFYTLNHTRTNLLTGANLNFSNSPKSFTGNIEGWDKLPNGGVYDVKFTAVLETQSINATLSLKKDLNLMDQYNGKKIMIDADDNYYVYGTKQVYQGDSYLLIRKYNAAGALQWEKYLGIGCKLGDFCLDSTGNPIVASENDRGYAIITKYSNSGSLIYSTISEHSDNFEIKGVTVDQENNIIAAGEMSNDVYVAKYEANTGQLIWRERVAESGESSLDVGCCINNQIYLMSSNYLYMIDSTGKIMWSKTQGLYETNIVNTRLAVGNDGCAYVVGTEGYGDKKLVVLKANQLPTYLSQNMIFAYLLISAGIVAYISLKREKTKDKFKEKFSKIYKKYGKYIERIQNVSIQPEDLSSPKQISKTIKAVAKIEDKREKLFAKYGKIAKNHKKWDVFNAMKKIHQGLNKAEIWCQNYSERYNENLLSLKDEIESCVYSIAQTKDVQKIKEHYSKMKKEYKLGYANIKPEKINKAFEKYLKSNKESIKVILNQCNDIYTGKKSIKKYRTLILESVHDVLNQIRDGTLITLEELSEILSMNKDEIVAAFTELSKKNKFPGNYYENYLGNNQVFIKQSTRPVPALTEEMRNIRLAKLNDMVDYLWIDGALELLGFRSREELESWMRNIPGFYSMGLTDTKFIVN